MWRGKAALGILRQIRSLAARDRILGGAKDVLRQILKRYDLATCSREIPLTIDTASGAAVDFSLPAPDVLDGLKELVALGGKLTAHKEGAPVGEDYPRVMRAFMIASSGKVSDVPLRLSVSAHICATDMIRAPSVHSPKVPVIESEPDVRTVAVLPESVAVKDVSSRTRLPELSVRDQTRKAATYPHIRSGIDLDRIDPQERDGFLREAESMKGVAYGQGELLALFRNVPVELIEKAHYSEEKRLLLYTLESAGRPARTRLHDLGIVRDSVAGKTHMIVHRRQFKSVQIA